MQEDISYSEYRRLLVGLMEDTPLGRVVQVRSESDPKTINEMTAQEKKIRSDWSRFRAKNSSCNAQNITMTVEQLQNLFRSFAEGG